MNLIESLRRLLDLSSEEKPEDLPGKTTVQGDFEPFSGWQAPAPPTSHDAPAQPPTAQPRSKEELEVLQIIERAAQDGVTELDLSGRDITTLPPEIGQLTNLILLYLVYNKLRTLPPEIGQLTNLTTLYLDRNQLSTLPPEIGLLTNLSTLDLGYNQLSSLPADIGQLTNLTRLDLSGNQLTSLPVWIGQLTNLTTLDLRSNQLSTLPAEIGQLTNLTTLLLQRNQLSTLPTEIGGLTKLTSLDLSSHQLRTLPPGIGELTSLTTLRLERNKLSTLPADIGQLTYLTTLSLYDNQLSSLPAEIGQLTSLTTLDLEKNQLSTLPPEMAQLTNLKGLDLRDNPLPIPPEILKRTTEPATILDYYFRGRKKPLNEAKLVLVGEGRVGKTSLVRRLVEDQFDPYERITEGIAIKGWKVTVGEAEVKLNVWDFGGQEIMHATHQFFLTLRSLYVLVLDVQQDEASNRLAYWFKMIESFGANSPIIVVSNQIDQSRKLFLNRGELIKKYPNIKAFVETSCQSGDGIAKLNAQIRAQVDVLAHVRDQIPIQWLTVKSELESLRKDYVAYDDYVALCQANDIHQEREQRVLIELLHDLGVVLNFPDPRLRETNVLNPSWVTGGVYQIIHAQSILQRQGIRDMGQLGKGILEVGQLDQILDQERYPREKHLFILDMMRKFELCFDLDGHLREKFLIPDLLPESEPRPRQPLYVDSFNVELQYEFLPRSVISSLMVRMNREIFEDTYWRHGIVLVHNANRAIIKALPERKKIIISIIGEHKSRPAFWQRINKELNEIHRHIKRLTCKHKVPIYKKPECAACGKSPTTFAANYCSRCGKQFLKSEAPICANCDVSNPIGAKFCFKCDVALWPLPVATVGYGELYDLHQKGVETHYVKGKDGMVEVHVQELLEGVRATPKPAEPEEIVALKKVLGTLRLRVHPKHFSELTLFLGQWYYEKVGDHSSTRIALEDGHHAIEALRRLMQDERAQVGLSAESVKLYEMLVRCCVVEQQFDKAFEYAAAAKGRSFVNQLAEARIDLARTEAQKPDFAQKLRRARHKRREIEKLESQIGADKPLAPSGNKGAGQIGEKGANRHDLLGQQEVLLREEAELWREMEHEFPVLTATLSVPRLEASEARALAKELDATLVEYYRHAGGWCAFVVTSDRIRYEPLPLLEGELLPKLLKWRNKVHLSYGRNELLLRRLDRLYEAAIAPLALESERVVIAPFERLHLLPLSAARNPKGYLADEHTLSFVPSLTALYVVNQERKRHQWSDQDGLRLLSVAYPGPPHNSLPNVLDEAQAIVKRLSKVATIDALHEQEATPDNVIREASRYDMIHFGCHGRFKPDKPEESGLRLAGPKEEAYLTVQRIITELNLKPTRLATLAACLSGEVKLQEGEEHVGLLQAMMTAGTQTVVASLWHVDDAATRALFEAFYYREADIHSAPLAMRDASQLLRQKWSHPYYWAAFTVNGFPPLPKKTAPAEWPRDLLEHIEKDNQRSIMTRGVTMNDQQLIKDNAEVLLETMWEFRSELLPALRQHPLSDELAEQSIVADPVEIAKALLLIVQDNPTLRQAFPDAGAGKIRLDEKQDADETTRESPLRGKGILPVRNKVVKVGRYLDLCLQQDDSPLTDNGENVLTRFVAGFRSFISRNN